MKTSNNLKNTSKSILQDEKGYQAQINCDKVFDNYNSSADNSDRVHVLAGEDGLISVNFIMLEKMTNSTGFLTHIEDVCQMVNGDLVVVCIDGDMGLYVYNEKEKTYSLKKLSPPTTDDCLYYIISNEKLNPENINKDLDKNIRSVTVWGEKNIKYIIIV